MLASSALVLLMTGPGLALFYSSLVRKRNVLGTMMQSFVMMAAVSLLWFVCGYSLAFAEGNPFIGDLRYAFLRGVGAAPNAHYAATIPHQTFMIYQLMFAIITPALIAGAFADRVRFGAMLVFSLLWTTIVYFPAAHMVWGKGGYFNAFLGGVIPVFDFAGRTVVHITSGISALVCAFYIGRRHGYPHEPMPPHSLVLSFIGACLRWHPAHSSLRIWRLPPAPVPGCSPNASAMANPVLSARFPDPSPDSPPSRKARALSNPGRA